LPHNTRKKIKRGNDNMMKIKLPKLDCKTQNKDKIEKIPEEDQFKKDIEKYTKELIQKNIPVEKLTESDIYVVGRWYGYKIASNVIYNRTGILI
jgi:hypothetical protein